jgi:hypothetical protein
MNLSQNPTCGVIFEELADIFTLSVVYDRDMNSSSPSGSINEPYRQGPTTELVVSLTGLELLRSALNSLMRVRCEDSDDTCRIERFQGVDAIRSFLLQFGMRCI